MTSRWRLQASFLFFFKEASLIRASEKYDVRLLLARQLMMAAAIRLINKSTLRLGMGQQYLKFSSAAKEKTVSYSGFPVPHLLNGTLFVVSQRTPTGKFTCSPPRMS